MGILRIIAAVLLPPLGVFLTMGVGQALIINILLTLLGWIPGVIHAFWVMSKK
ncbi:MAG: YqaE/Pmp3 family membrane protein [Cyanobacteria bacterium J06621_8]